MILGGGGSGGRFPVWSCSDPKVASCRKGDVGELVAASALAPSWDVLKELH